MVDAESGRIALIRFNIDGTQFVGSGLLVNRRAILTADHVADGSEYQVDCWDYTHQVAEVLRSGSPEVDLAILILKHPVADVKPLRYARVNRDRVSQIDNCVAVGFPRWKRDGSVRRSAQINGTIPTAEGLEQSADQGLREGLLTLVGNRDPIGPPIRKGPMSEVGTTSRWGGMSGAVVTSDGSVIGVVRSVNLAADNRSLTLTPLTAIEILSNFALKRRFWDVLGVSDPESLNRLPMTENADKNGESGYISRSSLGVGIGTLTVGAILGEKHGHRQPPDHHSIHTPTSNEVHASTGGLEPHPDYDLHPDYTQQDDSHAPDDPSQW